jgi:hypothetical protein
MIDYQITRYLQKLDLLNHVSIIIRNKIIFHKDKRNYFAFHFHKFYDTESFSERFT